MSRCVYALKLILCLGVCLGIAGEAFAKGGRGGSRGGRGGGRSFSGKGSKGGGAKNNGGFKTGRSPATKHGGKPDAGSFGPRNSTKGNKGAQLPRGNNKSAADGGTLDHHSRRELNKLNHRRQIADHLRSVSEKNGNENLKRVADDMDLRAQKHYDRQMKKFDPTYTPNDVIEDPVHALDDRIESGPVQNTVNRQTPPDSSDAPQKLTGTENALSRQVRNEERKLAKRLESVERMRELANQSGDEELLQTADRLEEWAMNDFDQRMTKVTDFQQRHGLPDVSNYRSE